MEDFARRGFFFVNICKRLRNKCTPGPPGIDSVLAVFAFVSVALFLNKGGGAFKRNDFRSIIKFRKKSAARLAVVRCDVEFSRKRRKKSGFSSAARPSDKPHFTCPHSPRNGGDEYTLCVFDAAVFQCDKLALHCISISQNP